MALISCTECGKEFSDKAAACPNCACPTDEMAAETPTFSSEPSGNVIDDFDSSGMVAVNGVFVDMQSIAKICGYGKDGGSVAAAFRMMEQEIASSLGFLPMGSLYQQARKDAVNNAYREILSSCEPFDNNIVELKKGFQIDLSEVLKVTRTSSKKGGEYIVEKAKEAGVKVKEQLAQRLIHGELQKYLDSWQAEPVEMKGSVDGAQIEEGINEYKGIGGGSITLDGDNLRLKDVFVSENFSINEIIKPELFTQPHLR